MKSIRYRTKAESGLKVREITCDDAALAANLTIARAEAYNGEVTVEDIPDIETEQTADDVLNALLGVSE